MDLGDVRQQFADYPDDPIPLLRVDGALTVGFMTMNSTDGDIRTVYYLAWKQCPVEWTGPHASDEVGPALCGKLLRTVFAQPDADAVQARMRHVLHVLDVLETKFPQAAH